MRNLLLPFAVVVLLLATSAAAVPEDWRDKYKDRDHFAARAIWDFDAAANRLKVLLNQLEAEGAVTPAGAERIKAEVERIEFDYVKSHFPHSFEGAMTNSGYDANFGEATRSSGQALQLFMPPVEPPAPPKK